jgi:hypothetical protein
VRAASLDGTENFCLALDCVGCYIALRVGCGCEMQLLVLDICGCNETHFFFFFFFFVCEFALFRSRVLVSF